jgi:hypothetical protein
MALTDTRGGSWGARGGGAPNDHVDGQATTNSTGPRLGGLTALRRIGRVGSDSEDDQGAELPGSAPSGGMNVVGSGEVA